MLCFVVLIGLLGIIVFYFFNIQVFLQVEIFVDDVFIQLL